MKEIPITSSDIKVLQSIEPRKSILNFTAEEQEKTAKWAERFLNDIGEKSPYFRINNEWRDREETTVPIIEIKHTGATFKSVKESIKNHEISRGNVVNTDTGWTIQISRRGLEDTVAHASSHNDKHTYDTLYSLNEIVKNSVLLDSTISEKNNANKADNTAFMHKMYSAIKLNEELYVAKLAIEEMFNGTTDTNMRLYNLQDIKIEPLRHLTFTDKRLALSVLNSSDISISDLFSLVKTFDKDFYLNKREKEIISEISPENTRTFREELENMTKWAKQVIQEDKEKKRGKEKYER